MVYRRLRTPADSISVPCAKAVSVSLSLPPRSCTETYVTGSEKQAKVQLRRLRWPAGCCRTTLVSCLLASVEVSERRPSDLQEEACSPWLGTKNSGVLKLVVLQGVKERVAHAAAAVSKFPIFCSKGLTGSTVMQQVAFLEFKLRFELFLNVTVTEHFGGFCLKSPPLFLSSEKSWRVKNNAPSCIQKQCIRLQLLLFKMPLMANRFCN